MPIHNADIAAIFEEIADLLEIESANMFRVRAFRNASYILQELGKDVRTMEQPQHTARDHRIQTLPGFGEKTEIHVADTLAKESGFYLELNANPDRQDLLDNTYQAAKEEGVLISIDSDAHSVLDFDNLSFGVGQARRVWLEKRDVLNTRPLKELRSPLRCTM